MEFVVWFYGDGKPCEKVAEIRRASDDFCCCF